MPPRPPAFVLICFVVLTTSGCGRVSEADRAAAIQCVRANLEAMQKSDLAGLTATLHPESPAIHNTPEAMLRLAKTYKLKFELEECEVESASSDGIHIRFVQTLRRVGGPEDFADSRMEGMHLLKRDGKAWKIWFTHVRQSRTLDGDPLPVQAAAAEPMVSAPTVPSPNTPPPVRAAVKKPAAAPEIPAPPAVSAAATPGPTPSVPLVPFRTQR
jgi:hypothetical protein